MTFNRHVVRSSIRQCLFIGGTEFTVRRSSDEMRMCFFLVQVIILIAYVETPRNDRE